MYVKNDAAKHWSMLQSSACLVTVARRRENKSYSLTITNVQANCFLYNSTASVQYVIKLSWSCSSWCLNLLANPLLSVADLLSPLEGITSMSILPQAHRQCLHTSLSRPRIYTKPSPFCPPRISCLPRALQPVRGTFPSFCSTETCTKSL